MAVFGCGDLNPLESGRPVQRRWTERKRIGTGDLPANHANNANGDLKISRADVGCYVKVFQLMDPTVAHSVRQRRIDRAAAAPRA